MLRSFTSIEVENKGTEVWQERTKHGSHGRSRGINISVSDGPVGPLILLLTVWGDHI